MRLESIEMVGFKSFADKVKIKFHEGITAIVGPNGCGKSNISDGFRWVLGEQSAKSLRGQKMQDIIFAGTSTRKPLNFAEVTVTFTDVQGKLPVDFEEISITRRVHRSGESEYLINRHPVRLKDVQALFLDTGMGKDAYSIFEQGKVDQVINYTALERRYIFEEAAGILRFLQRKREALKKLEQVELNISRVKDIHAEVAKQIVVLEEQAEKARAYKDNKNLQEELERGIFGVRWDMFLKRLEELKKKEEALRVRIAELQEIAKGLLNAIDEAKHSQIEAEKALKVRSEALFNARTEREIKSRDKLSCQERLKESLMKEKKWMQELEEIRMHRHRGKSEQETAKKQMKASELELSRAEDALKAQRAIVNDLETCLSKHRQQMQVLQQEHLRKVQAEKALENEVKQQGLRLENVREKRKHHGEKDKQLSIQIEDLTLQCQEKQKLLKELTDSVDVQKSRLDYLEQEHDNLQADLKLAQASVEKLHKELTEHRARQKVLLKMRQEMEGFSAGSKKLLMEASNPKSPIYQKLKPLYESIVPSKGVEDAAGAVLKPYIQTLTVKTKDDFDLVVEHAGKLGLKDFSILCLEWLPDDARLHTEGSLAALFEQGLAKAFLNNAWVVSTLDEAVRQKGEECSREVFIKETGAFFDAKGVLFFSTQGENNVFLREAELKDLELKLQNEERILSEQEALMKKMQQRKQSVYEEKLELDKGMRKTEMKLVEANFAYQRAQGDLQKSRQESEQIKEELRLQAEALEKLSAVLEELQERHVQAKDLVSAMQAQSQSILQELEKQQTLFKIEQNSLQEKETAYHRMTDELRKVQHSIHVLELKESERMQQENRLEEEIENSRDLQEKIRAKSLEFEQMLNDVEEILKEASAACEEQEGKVAKWRGQIGDLEKQLQEEFARVKKEENELHQASVQSAQMQTALDALAAEFQERYDLQLSEARASIPLLKKSLDQTEKQLKALRQELDSYGDINMTSIEEFEKHKVRYEFLNRQIEDMQLSKKELVRIISELDTESRKVFRETFEQIRINFKKNFEILFNGGEADLQFTESNDVLEAGIEIIAKPPGKQMRSINLMSGGEKCLTAMALLFAIFEVKPAPYCILDEMDAPLDDTNVERFVNVLKQFIDRCQFIIVTHNKRTMAIADVLFGVSMEEKGVSKILSMEFSHSPLVTAVS